MCWSCGQGYPGAIGMCGRCGGVNTVGVRWLSPSAHDPDGRYTHRSPVRSVAELRGLRMTGRRLAGDLGDWLGPLPRLWSMLLYGAPGSGKTTMALRIADAAATAGARVLFVSGEEGGGSEAFLSRMTRLEVTSNVLVSSAATRWAFLEDLEEIQPDLAVVDSVPVLGVTLDDLAKIHDGGRCSVVLITHLTKAGDPAGPSGLAHAVDVVAQVEEMRAQTTKNRYAPLGPCKVLP